MLVYSSSSASAQPREPREPRELIVAAVPFDKNVPSGGPAGIGMQAAPAAQTGQGGLAWIARIDLRDPANAKATLYQRDRARENTWFNILQIPIAAITRDGPEAVVILSPTGGSAIIREWAWASSQHFSRGPDLPGKGEIIAMAGGDKGLWALGRLTTAIASTAPSSPTSPASRPRATTKPVAATSPLSPRIALLRLQRTWQEQPAEWPADLAIASPGDVSMALVGGVPHLAILNSDYSLVLLKYAAEHWQEIPSSIPVGASRPRFFRLLDINGAPHIWMQSAEASADPGGALFSANGEPIALPLLPLSSTATPAVKPTQVDVAIVNGLPRLYYISADATGEHLIELPGSGKPQILSSRSASAADMNWLTIAVGVILTLLLLNMLLRRREEQREKSSPEDE